MDESDDQYIETLYAAPRGAPVLVLRHRFGSLAGTSHTFRAGRVTLGRRRDCEVHFDSHLDRMVSARHACIEQSDGRWILEDLGSTNGTFVNGREIHGRIALAHGDEIVLGSDETDGSVGFSVEMTEDSSPRESEARTAIGPRETPRDPAPDLEKRNPPPPARPEATRLEAPRGEPVRSEAAAAIPADASIEIGGPAPDPAELATLRGELRALELTIPATRAAAEMATRALAEAAWNRGGVDWSSCPSIAAVLECERLAREAESTAAQFAAEHGEDEARRTSRTAAARARLEAAETRAGELDAGLRAANERIVQENARLAGHCAPLFLRLDELSLVLSEIVAKHRPDVDDDVLGDLAELKERLLPVTSSLGDDEAEIENALKRRRAAAAESAELTEAIAANAAELEAARKDSTRIEAEELRAADERRQQRELAQKANRERAAELAARFSALGSEAARSRLQGIVETREFQPASAALAALDAAEARIAELRALLARSGSRDGAPPARAGERP